MQAGGGVISSLNASARLRSLCRVRQWLGPARGAALQLEVCRCEQLLPAAAIISLQSTPPSVCLLLILRRLAKHLLLSTAICVAAVLWAKLATPWLGMQPTTSPPREPAASRPPHALPRDTLMARAVVGEDQRPREVAQDTELLPRQHRPEDGDGEEGDSEWDGL